MTVPSSFGYLLRGIDVAMQSTIWVETYQDASDPGITHYWLSAWNYDRLQEKITQLMNSTEDAPGNNFASFDNPRKDQNGKWHSKGFVFIHQFKKDEQGIDNADK